MSTYRVPYFKQSPTNFSWDFCPGLICSNSYPSPCIKTNSHSQVIRKGDILMRRNGKIKGTVYEATLVEGSRIYRVFLEEKLLAECNAKDLKHMPHRLKDKGFENIAEDLVDTLPNLRRCTCKVCGKEFIGASSRNYTCSEECLMIAHRRRASGREVYKNVNTGRQFIADSIEARKLGMSYGKYKALQYIANGGTKVLLFDDEDRLKAS